MFEESTRNHLTIIFGLPALFLFRSALRQSNKPPSPITTISNYFLLFSVIYEVYFAFFSPPGNLFQLLGVGEDAPLFLIRNMLQAYIDTNPLSEKAIEQMLTLCDKLKSDQNRHIYCFFGEYALLNCIWCQEDLDYVMFILPFLVASYLYMFFLVWFVSSSSQRAYVRSYSIMLLLILSFIDIFALSHGFKSFGISFIHSTTDFYRRITFAVMSLGLWCAGYADDAHEQELLQQLINHTEKIIGQQESLKLVRNLCLGDPELRPKFLEQAEQQVVACNTIRADPEYKNGWVNVARRMRTVELLKYAQMATEKVLKSALK